MKRLVVAVICAVSLLANAEGAAASPASGRDMADYIATGNAAALPRIMP